MMYFLVAFLAMSVFLDFSKKSPVSECQPTVASTLDLRTSVRIEVQRRRQEEQNSDESFQERKKRHVLKNGKTTVDKHQRPLK